ncbi:MAG: phosphate acyltransferase PlsX [Verrucomicrobiota bacterium]|nr:phosphate acyltransferase PlsX [Verrucomicrobiota bacterium]
MRIAVDAMGGDFAPLEIVRGAVRAANEIKGLSKVVLVGDQQAIRRELDKYAPVPKIVDVFHASEVVAMDEAPALAVRRKRDSSISRSIDLVKSGEVDAMVSAGNTGAVVAAATLKLRALEGLERPAIAAVMPTPKRPFVLIDAGANTDCSPTMLAEFAVMGSVYSRAILGQPKPVVGLMSIGGEDIKGNEITKGTFRLLDEADLNFRGNVEGHDLFVGETDVVVCDGFVGNIVLKTSESVAKAVAGWTRQEFVKNPARMLGALFLMGALRAMKRRLDPESYGGAPLLGVNGVCIITHGSSSARAILHAVRVAREEVSQRLNEVITREVSQLVGPE